MLGVVFIYHPELGSLRQDDLKFKDKVSWGYVA
jgi:hypothetical protein